MIWETYSYGVFHRGVHRLSTVNLFGASYFRHFLLLLILNLQTMPNKRLQTWSKKPSSNKIYKKGPIRGINYHQEYFLEGLVKRVLDNKEASNHNKMSYVYDPKLLKEYRSAPLSWIYNTLLIIDGVFNWIFCVLWVISMCYCIFKPLFASIPHQNNSVCYLFIIYPPFQCQHYQLTFHALVKDLC